MVDEIVVTEYSHVLQPLQWLLSSPEQLILNFKDMYLVLRKVISIEVPIIDFFTLELVKVLEQSDDHALLNILAEIDELDEWDLNLVRLD